MPQLQERERTTTPDAAGPAPAGEQVATGDGAAASHQSAELLESMGLPSGPPGQTDPGAAQSEEISAAGAETTASPSGGGGEAATEPASGAAAGGGEGTPYTVVAGDFLWKIAEAHYQSPHLWRAIYHGNREVIGGDPNAIEPGMQLVLPTLDAIIGTHDHRQTVQIAFGLRWGVDVAREPGAARIPIDTFRRVHNELLRLPPAHVQGTWRRLLHLDDSSGAYMSHDGEFGLGEDAAGAGNERFGSAELALTEDAAAGATTIELDPTSLIGPGVAITLDDAVNAEMLDITAVNGERTDFTVDPALAHPHGAGTLVTATDNPIRETPWLEAVVRHEIAHAIDGSLVDSTGLTQSLGGWNTTTSFDDWAALMGDPWATNDGSTISDAEKTEIKTVIDGLRSTPTSAGLDNGLAPDHAIIKYWDKQVPVIEAAKPMAAHGSDYWGYSEEYHGTNGRFFTINDYYQEFHSFNAQVQYNQVRSYQTYSPAEFFAEVYSVYYEEAGTEGSTPGALLPVAAWKSWMDANVGSAGASPADATAAGGGSPSRGKSAGVSH